MSDPGKKSLIGRYFLFFALLVMLAAAAVFLLPVYRNHCRKKAELQAEQERLRKLEEERAALRVKTEDLRHSPAAVEKVARERFRLVKPGETVLHYKNRQKNKE